MGNPKTLEELEAELHGMMQIFVGTHGETPFISHEHHNQFWQRVQWLQDTIHQMKKPKEKVLIVLKFNEQYEHDSLKVEFHNGGITMARSQGAETTVIEIDAIIQELYTLHQKIEALTAFKWYAQRMKEQG